MSESLVVCDVAEDLVEKLRKFRFRKETNNAAIIMKIDKDKQLVVLDEEHEGISPDELKDELPERQPRYPSYAAAIWTYSLLEAVQHVGLHLFRPIIAVV
ncbi:Glia maturation factor beta [Turdus rufiventris]|nr:Glia maturation factor beta [Turdus rufiventris]